MSIVKWCLCVAGLLLYSSIGTGCTGLYESGVPENHEMKLTTAPFAMRIGRYLAECPAAEPGRPVRAMLLPQSGKIDRLPELGMGCGRLPNDVDLAVVLIPTEQSARECGIPDEDSIAVATGNAMALPADVVSRLTEKNGLAIRRCLTERERRSVIETMSVLNIRFGAIRVIPLTVPSQGVGPDMLAALLAEMITGHTAMIGLTVSENLAEQAESDGVGKTVKDVCNRLNLLPFDMVRHVRQSYRKQVPAEDQREWHIRTYLDTSVSLGLMEMGRNRGWQRQTLLNNLEKARNAVKMNYEGGIINEAEEQVLLSLARFALVNGVRKKTFTKEDLPQYSMRLLQPYGGILTLKIDGKVYATVSVMGGKQPFVATLLQLCAKMVQDEKHPLTEDHLKRGKLMLGVITSPVQLSFKSLEELYIQLEPGKSGVVLRAHGQAPGFIPQVWRQFKDVPSFMSALCRQAKLSDSVLLEPETQVLRFEVVSCEEK